MRRRREKVSFAKRRKQMRCIMPSAGRLVSAGGDLQADSHNGYRQRRRGRLELKIGSAEPVPASSADAATMTSAATITPMSRRRRLPRLYSCHLAATAAVPDAPGPSLSSPLEQAGTHSHACDARLRRQPWPYSEVLANAVGLTHRQL
jgi:hypothetical protein